MNADDRDVREYVDRKSAHLVSAEIYRRLATMVALWKQEERMKKDFTVLALALFCVLVVLPAAFRTPLWHWGALAWLAFFAMLSVGYWRKSAKLRRAA